MVPTVGPTPQSSKSREAARYDELISEPNEVIGCHTSFPDNGHRQNTGSHCKVDWDHPQAIVQWTLSLKYTIFGDQKDDGCETTGDRGSDTCCEEFSKRESRKSKLRSSGLPQAAKTWETPFQVQLIPLPPSVAKPVPMIPPMIECVV